MIFYHTDEFEKKATNYCIRVWSLVMVRNQLPAQLVKRRCVLFKGILAFSSRRMYLEKNLTILECNNARGTRGILIFSKQLFFFNEFQKFSGKGWEIGQIVSQGSMKVPGTRFQLGNLWKIRLFSILCSFKRIAVIVTCNREIYTTNFGILKYCNVFPKEFCLPFDFENKSNVRSKIGSLYVELQSQLQIRGIFNEVIKTTTKTNSLNNFN